MIKNRWGMAALLSAAFVWFSPTANAGVYIFDVNAFGTDASGTFTTDTANGLTGNILTLTGNVTGLGAGTISFTAGAGSDSSFIWDNIVYPGLNPQLDINGIMFKTATYEFNVWGNSPGDYSFYAASLSNPGVYPLAASGKENVSGFITAVPELSTWGMMLIGFAGIGFVAYRRAQKSPAAAAVA